jgi:Flp pilus assembly protein TadB
MLKFIPGILILQIVTIVLVLIVPGDMADWGWLRLAIPVMIAGFLTAFWFGSIAAQRHKDDINRLKKKHAKERETIRVNAERDKTRLLKNSQRKTRQEVRRTSRQSNVKAGLIFAGAAGLGGVLILTQFMSLGMLLLTAAGSALGGYLLRIRQEKRKPQQLTLPTLDPQPPRIIKAQPDKEKQLTLKRSPEKE